MEHPGDLDDDGDVGTRRELEEECGGGSPHGLPSLIHIECYKSGKVGLRRGEREEDEEGWGKERFDSLSA